MRSCLESCDGSLNFFIAACQLQSPRYTTTMRCIFVSELQSSCDTATVRCISAAELLLHRNCALHMYMRAAERIYL